MEDPLHGDAERAEAPKLPHGRHAHHVEVNGGEASVVDGYQGLLRDRPFFVVLFSSFSPSFSCGRAMPARAMAPFWGDPRVPLEVQLGQLRWQWRLGLGPWPPPCLSLAGSLASLALGAFLVAQVVCMSVSQW